jgi:hypothetical protein
MESVIIVWFATPPKNSDDVMLSATMLCLSVASGGTYTDYFTISKNV